MATVDGITAAEAKRIENASVVSGLVKPDGNLYLVTHDNREINAGDISGPLNAHVIDTSTHGVGEVVGRTETQIVTNKTLTTPTIASFINAQHSHVDAASGGKAWPFSGCRAYKTTPLTVQDSTTKYLTFDIEDYDTDSYFAPGGWDFNIAVPGYYEVLAQALWTGNSVGRRFLDIRLNDGSPNGTTGVSIGKSNPSPGHGTNFNMQVSSGTKKFVANDQIRVYVAQFSGITIDVLGSVTDAVTFVSITRKG